MLADNHALIDRHLRVNEHDPAILQIENGIGDRRAGFRCDERAIAPTRNIAAIGAIAVENAVQNARAARVRQKPAGIANKAARWRMKNQPRFACACGAHVLHHGFAFIEGVNHGTRIFLININCHFFNGLQTRAVFLADQHARARNGHFKTFASHCFDEHAELQFAASANFKRVFIGAFIEGDGDICFGFCQQAFADDGRGYLFAFPAGKRAVIDGNGDRHCRWVNRCGGKRCVHFRIANRVGNRCFGKPGNANQIARMHGVNGDTLGALKTQELGKPPGFDLFARQIDCLDWRIDFRHALDNAPCQAAANIGVAVEQGGQHGKRFVGGDLRCGHVR